MRQWPPRSGLISLFLLLFLPTHFSRLQFPPFRNSGIDRRHGRGQPVRQGRTRTLKLKKAGRCRRETTETREINQRQSVMVILSGLVHVLLFIPLRLRSPDPEPKDATEAKEDVVEEVDDTVTR